MQTAAKVQAERYHDISCGHVVYGHENKCRHMHGHNYRIHFTIEGDTDSIGRVLDFGVIKSKLCMWLEDNWDHKFLIWDKHPMAHDLKALDDQGVLHVPFNPTAENMALHLLHLVGPEQLKDTGAFLTKVVVEETAKCQAQAFIHS